MSHHLRRALAPSLLLLVGSWLAAADPAAQGPTADPVRLAKSEQLMSVMDMEHALKAQTSLGFEAQFSQMDKQLAQLPPAMQTAFKEAMVEVKTLVQKDIDYGAYSHEIAGVYADLYTSEQLDQLLAFYATPVGQRLIATQAELLGRSSKFGAAHAADLMPKIQAIIRSKMSAAAKQDGGDKDEAEADDSLGKPFAGFTATTLDGKPFALDQWKGKVVVVDFWATWCGPCRGEMPNVKALYGKQHAAGLEIVGVSLDEDKEALTTYLAKEQIPWTQVFDGKGWENAVAQKFGIHSIPATFLIGRDGTLIAKGLRGEELSAAVEKALAGGPATEPARPAPAPVMP